MIEQQQLLKHLDQLLHPELFNDYAPNGLQVQGKQNIKTLVSGVTASQALIEQAIELDADAILVHHGYFWQGENPTIVGMKYQRLKKLLSHDINLYAYHLPLDAHPIYGNNAQLATLLGINHAKPMASKGIEQLIFQGELNNAISGSDLQTLIEQKIQTNVLHIASDLAEKTIKTIALCTGGAQKYIDYAIKAGADAYITGEASEATVHTAREMGIHFFAAGHHATERFGVRAIGEHLATTFDLQHHFIDIPNPV